MRHGASGASRKQGLHPILEMGLLVLSAALFSLSFPNPLNTWGFGPLSFIAVFPLMVVVNRTTWPRLFFYALVAGFLTYSCFNYWLAAYHPVAIFLVSAIYAFMYLLLLPCLKLAKGAFPRIGWLAQALIWVAWEFCRTQGFLGYPYGILGYSQYLFLPLSNSASFFGVWGVSLIVVWPSMLLAWRFKDPSQQPNLIHSKDLLSKLRAQAIAWLSEIRARRIAYGAWAAVLLIACGFGIISMVDYGKGPEKRLALVQQNVDPWIGGLSAYTESLRRLIRQSDAALSADPTIEMVVWSETSFIPAIEYHYRFRDDPERFALVRQLKEYFASKPIPFVLGNDDAEAYIDAAGNRARREYNAVLLYQGSELRQSYHKMRLVPFTEHFPYKDQFPWLYQLLRDTNTSFWESGDQYVVMQAAGFRFGTPICFEDSFGYISRDFVRAGAQVILNLSNDSWSKSESAAMQHLAMATFRAIENRRSVVRSTNGGMSGLIDPNGKILALNQAFTESYLIVDVPIYDFSNPLTLYWGDWFAWVCLIAAAASLGFAGLRPLVGRRAAPAQKVD